MRTKVKLVTVIAASLALSSVAACGKPGERMRFNGNYYPAKLTQEGDRRADFSVAVRDVAQGITGAREAGRFEATRYCVETFGDSDVTWRAGYGPEDGSAITDNGALILRGTCVIW